ncbi:MAG: hypothetical protein KGK16_15410 [Bradyrhizobium sp.]|nr:hypothetical protein [Bradyrhizobium sp.]
MKVKAFFFSLTFRKFRWRPLPIGPAVRFTKRAGIRSISRRVPQFVRYKVEVEPALHELARVAFEIAPFVVVGEGVSCIKGGDSFSTASDTGVLVHEWNAAYGLPRPAIHEDRLALSVEQEVARVAMIHLCLAMQREEAIRAQNAIGIAVPMTLPSFKPTPKN